MGSQKHQLPTINFKGLDLNEPLGSNWETARTEVLAALKSYGCFDAVYDGVRPEVNESLFHSIMPETFALPLEVKQKNKSNGYWGYIGQITDVPYESLRIHDAPNPESVERFAGMLWPEGNQMFCNTVTTYAQQARNLEQIVERMIFQSLGTEKYCNSHLESLVYEVRLANYGGLPTEEAKVSLLPHVDPNLITIVRQNGVEGLEVYTKDGECIRVVPSPDTFTIMIGETMTVLTNGRFCAPLHSVSVNQKRYSVMVGSSPKEGHLIQPLKEMVDENHPLQFHPFDFNKYMQFKRFLKKNMQLKHTPEGEGLKTENPLKGFLWGPRTEKLMTDSFSFLVSFLKRGDMCESLMHIYV